MRLGTWTSEGVARLFEEFDWTPLPGSFRERRGDVVSGCAIGIMAESRGVDIILRDDQIAVALGLAEHDYFGVMGGFDTYGTADHKCTNIHQRTGFDFGADVRRLLATHRSSSVSGPTPVPIA